MTSGPIGRHVPHLRRFARALSGSRQLGDAFVGATLRALLDDGTPLAAPYGLRLALYKTFFETWRRQVALPPPQDGGCTHPVDRRLQALVPLNRVMFLLSSMEGFDEEEVAVITDTNPVLVQAMVEEAEQALSRELETRVLIIEDEWFIAADLTRIVESMGHTVVGQATRRDTAIAQASILKPGLILADIRLGRDNAGIEAVGEILKAAPVPVVFVTGYPERLLTGREPEPTYLVAKPFSDQAVKAMVAQALFFESAPTTARPE
jgi:CheY-like chemotaxis protein